MLEDALERGKRDADPGEVADADSRLQELLDQVADPAAVADQPVAETGEQVGGVPDLTGVAMRTATPQGVKGRTVTMVVRGVADPVEGTLGPGVSPEVVALAARNGDAVVLECARGEAPVVVGVLQTKIPAELTIKAKKLHLVGEQEVVLRSGRGAMRIRQDGDVEIVGSRIAAMSRGLFRLVGRVLRLN
ncbi:MAG: hypothetical protein JRI68_32145 [Deltaproteobacteria bacterium]|nr:hypothetical protein [Deltaproteobacteria bacterium]